MLTKQVGHSMLGWNLQNVEPKPFLIAMGQNNKCGGGALPAAAGELTNTEQMLRKTVWSGSIKRMVCKAGIGDTGRSR